MELTEYQLLYVQTVYDYFQENFQWPTYRQVQKKNLLKHRDFRALDVATSIEDNPTGHFPLNLEDRAAITLKEIHELPQAQQDLNDLLRVIQYGVEKYITEDTAGLRITSEETNQNLHLDETAIRKIYPLLGLTMGITQGSGNSLDYKTWHFVLADSIIDYQNLTSIDDYFARREERKKSYQANQSAHNALVVNQFLDAPVVTGKPRISVEVVNAITDPKESPGNNLCKFPRDT